MGSVIRAAAYPTTPTQTQGDPKFVCAGSAESRGDSDAKAFLAPEVEKHYSICGRFNYYGAKLSYRLRCEGLKYKMTRHRPRLQDCCSKRISVRSKKFICSKIHNTISAALWQVDFRKHRCHLREQTSGNGLYEKQHLIVLPIRRRSVSSCNYHSKFSTIL
jgi:hypothetical protein